MAASKLLLNIRNPALHNLIHRRLLLLLHPSSVASKNLFPSTSNQSLNYSFLLNRGCVESHGYSSIAVLPQSRLGYSLIQSEGGGIDTAKDDHDYEENDDDDEVDDDDIENYSGSDFDDEDEYEDPDEDPDARVEKVDQKEKESPLYGSSFSGFTLDS